MAGLASNTGILSSLAARVKVSHEWGSGDIERADDDDDVTDQNRNNEQCVSSCVTLFQYINDITSTYHVAKSNLEVFEVGILERKWVTEV